MENRSSYVKLNRKISIIANSSIDFIEPNLNKTFCGI